MKSPFTPSNKLRYLPIIVGLALAISLLGVLPVAAQALTAQATTNAAPTTPVPPAKKTAAAATAPDPKGITTAATTPDQESSLSEYNNWVTLGVGSTFVSGNQAEFQHERNTKSGVFGGIEDFHLEEFVGKTGTFTADGHAIVGNHDYDIHLSLTDPTLGYVRVGYTEFRTWYDGTGGYYPPGNESFSTSNTDLYVDRRSAWVEAGLTLPDLPVFSLRYEYDSREGTMDSTSWGDNGTALTGMPPDKKITSTFLGIDETRNIFQGNVTDKVDNTDMGLTLRYELDSTKDSTFIDLDPLNAGGTGANVNKFVTDYDVERNDIFNIHGFTETFFNDKVTFSSGFSYVNTGTNLDGTRISGSAYNTAFPQPSPFPAAGNAAIQAGFLDLGGYGTTNEYITNLNLMFTPIKDLTFISAVRLEYDESNLSDNYIVTSNTSATTPTGLIPYAANTNNWDLGVVESLEARYTGFRDWSLYATAELGQNWGNNSWNVTPVLDQTNFNEDITEISQKYTLGANWYPLAQLNFGGQYYHQIQSYDYDNRLANTPVQYPGYLQAQDFNTDDMNIRATWQALSNVSLVTRYDFQYSTVYTTGDPNTAGVASQAGGVQSCNMTNHIISENATWSPLARLYLDAGGSYVLNTVSTPAAGSAGVSNIVLDSKNDYWTVDVGAGYALDDKTDLRLQYTYYRAADYENNAGTYSTVTVPAATNPTNVGVPYGADTEEHNASVTLTHKFNKALEGSLRYSYSRYRDGSVGGQDDYEAHLVYASMKYGF
jgi:hypothetical protein